MQTESSSQPLCEQQPQQQKWMKKEKINSQCFQVTISLLRAFVSFTLVESNNNSSSNNNANIVDVDNDYDDDDVPTQKKEHIAHIFWYYLIQREKYFLLVLLCANRSELFASHYTLPPSHPIHIHSVFIPYLQYLVIICFHFFLLFGRKKKNTIYCSRYTQRTFVIRLCCTDILNLVKFFRFDVDFFPLTFSFFSPFGINVQ